MTHAGTGLFRLPTGWRLATRTVADCLVRDGVVRAEWLVRDQPA